jgi:hypothetical protein
MKRKYVAKFGYDGKAHAIRDGWGYDRIGSAKTLCGIRGPFGIEHFASGRRTEITCRNCKRLDSNK